MAQNFSLPEVNEDIINCMKWTYLIITTTTHVHTQTKTKQKAQKMRKIIVPRVCWRPRIMGIYLADKVGVL